MDGVARLVEYAKLMRDVVSVAQRTQRLPFGLTHACLHRFGKVKHHAIGNNVVHGPLGGLGVHFQIGLFQVRSAPNPYALSEKILTPP